MPWAFVAVTVVGMNAIGEAVGLRATGEGFVDVVMIALPWGFVEVMTVGTGTKLLVARMTLPCAFVEVTACGISVTGASTVNGEKVVKTEACPWLLVEVCNTATAAASVVETATLPCAFVEATAIGTIVADCGEVGLYAG